MGAARRLVSRAVAAWTAVGATLVGCGDPTAPVSAADVTGTYVLVSIDGVVPPIPYGTGTTIVADTTVYSADGTWAEVDIAGNAGEGLVPRRVQRYSGTWRLESARAVLYKRTSTSGTVLESAYVVRERGRTLEFTSADRIVWRYTRVP